MRKSGFLTISEAAKILNIHPNTLRNWEKQKKLIPLRDEATKYRYYSHEQIREYLLRGSVPKIEIKWGYDYSKKARVEELSCAKRTLDVLVSSEVSTYEKKIDEELFELLEEALLRGVKVRFIRNLNEAEMKKRAEKMRRMGIITKHRLMTGVTMSIRDKKIVRIEVPTDDPEQRFNLIIYDSRVAKSFLLLFNKLWGKS